MSEETKRYQVPKEKLKAGIKERWIYGKTKPDPEPLGKAPAQLKIIPLIE